MIHFVCCAFPHRNLPDILPRPVMLWDSFCNLPSKMLTERMLQTRAVHILLRADRKRAIQILLWAERPYGDAPCLWGQGHEEFLKALRPKHFFNSEI